MGVKMTQQSMKKKRDEMYCHNSFLHCITHHTGWLVTKARKLTTIPFAYPKQYAMITIPIAIIIAIADVISDWLLFKR